MKKFLVLWYDGNESLETIVTVPSDFDPEKAATPWDWRLVDETDDSASINWVIDFESATVYRDGSVQRPAHIDVRKEL
jgi:hypothetical protein